MNHLGYLEAIDFGQPNLNHLSRLRKKTGDRAHDLVLSEAIDSYLMQSYFLIKNTLKKVGQFLPSRTLHS